MTWHNREVSPRWAEFHDGLLRSHFKTVCYLFVAALLFYGALKNRGFPSFNGVSDGIQTKIYSVFVCQQIAFQIIVKIGLSKLKFFLDCSPDKISPVLEWFGCCRNSLKRALGERNNRPLRKFFWPTHQAFIGFHARFFQPYAGYRITGII